MTYAQGLQSPKDHAFDNFVDQAPLLHMLSDSWHQGHPKLHLSGFDG